MPRLYLGEVMWPRLVVNKVLRKRSGSSNFIADFPTEGGPTDALLEFQAAGLNPNTIFSPHKDTSNYRVFVSTWNVGGIAPDEDLDMEEILDTCNTSCHIYVLGFQEIVPLSAQNVMGRDNKKLCAKWNSLMRDALNNNRDQRCRKKKDEEAAAGSGGFRFRCIISKQMVGILISVWVRTDLCAYVRHPNVSCIGCGIFGCLGNKGSVSVRFQLHETSFCFVCSHLASGGGDRDGRSRNSDVSEILSRTTFPGGPLHDLPRNILDHDRVIFLGDLNYRISLPEETTRLLVERRDWNSLLENDQLRMKLIKGQFLGGWNEGNITFPPTYKYQINSDVYFGLFQPKTSQKRRSPAWCDRIIWFGEGLKQHLYTRCETKLSDHRPVKAIFTTEVGILNTIKGLQSLLLSNRFDTSSSNLELSETDNFMHL